MADAVLAVDVKGLRELARDLDRIADAGMRKSLRRALRKGGKVVADDAKSSAGAWSSRIPSSVRVGVTSKGVYVRAGGPKAPHAVTFEGRTDGGNRRHPVYAQGDREEWTWAEQEKRPYLVPALNANADRVADLVANEMEQLFKDNGWRE